MPYLKAGGDAPAPVTMQIEPDRILALKARYEAVRDTVQHLLEQWRYDLRVEPFALDEVSTEAAKIFSENATTAHKVTLEFVRELNRSIEQLEATAKTYNLVEEANTATVRQVDGGK
ncbi:MAG: PE domain-containing protein [Saccharothrix sp.]|nr:PE domain-containing protein [Saccharothrix sp.]